jgi:polyisoprenyl-teichoic acid--peptidoglycan teichoic acid transferase
MSVTTGARSRSASVAALLSFVWPGLGEWYAGNPRRAVAFAIPVVVAAVLLVIQLSQGFLETAVKLFSPSYALFVLLAVLALGILRAVSIAQAAFLVGGSPALRRGSSAATVATLVVISSLLHAWLAYGAWSFYSAGTDIFSGAVDGGQGGEPLPSNILDATPEATRTSPEDRLTVLITGVDSSPSRDHALTDTMIIASIDPKTHKGVMISIPRDLARFPLPDGRIYQGKINSLMTYAAAHPDQFPKGPLPTLIETLGDLVGVPIHYFAAIDLAGFVQIIDSVGGIDVVNQQQIDDPVYGGWTDNRPIGFHLSPGPHHLDGQNALAYARSRKGPGENDFTRARRQQQVLLALRAKLTDPAVIPQLPSLIQSFGKVLRTNVPPDEVPELLDLGKANADAPVGSVVLGPTKYATNPPLSEAGGQYILVPKMDAIAEESIKLFGQDSTYASAPAASPSTAP